VTGAILLVISLFFTPIAIHNPLHVVAFAFLTAVVFSLAGLINAIFAKNFDSISIFPTFILTPLTYLAGTFYSLSMLPAIWHQISLWNPLLSMVNGFRYGLIGATDVSIVTAYVILIVLASTLSFVVWYLFYSGRGVRM
jgi:ABC-2 type transport system permease protein